MSTNTHYEIDDLIAFVDAELDSTEMAKVNGHVESCEECREKVSLVRAKLEFFDERFNLKRLEQIDARVRARAALERERSAAPALAARLSAWIEALERMLIPPRAWEPQYAPGIKGRGDATRISLSRDRPFAELSISKGAEETVEVYCEGRSGLLMLSPAEGSDTPRPELRELKEGVECEEFVLSPGRYLFALEPAR